MKRSNSVREPNLMITQTNNLNLNTLQHLQFVLDLHSSCCRSMRWTLTDIKNVQPELRKLSVSDVGLELNYFHHQLIWWFVFSFKNCEKCSSRYPGNTRWSSDIQVLHKTKQNLRSWNYKMFCQSSEINESTTFSFDNRLPIKEASNWRCVSVIFWI